MTRWSLQLRSHDFRAIDAHAIRLGQLIEQSVSQAASLRVIADGRPVEVGELFDLRREDSDTDEIAIEGDLGNVHGLAAWHDRGTFTIIGDAGHYVAASMTGGTVRVEGNAGDFLAAPFGCEKTGMSGGQVRVEGCVGRYLGHRMRRGDVFVGADAGGLAAASMVAGTIAIAGNAGPQLAIGMKRGTILLGGQSDPLSGTYQEASELRRRFSEPLAFTADFLRLYCSSILQPIVERFAGGQLQRVRGDRSVGGQGEILFLG